MTIDEVVPFFGIKAEGQSLQAVTKPLTAVAADSEEGSSDE
jgi:hypothetical protein